MKKIPLILLPALLLVLASCDEDDTNDSDFFQTEIVGPEGILQNLKATNIDDIGFPWYQFGDRLDDFVKLKSWDIAQDGLIPVKSNGFDIAENALDEIEAKVGKTLFDRTSIANVPDNEVTRGIIVSQGTALGAFGSTTDPNGCGHVSKGIGTTAYPDVSFTVFENEDGDIIDYVQTGGHYDNNGNINTVLYVHLGAPACQSDINVDLAIHEIGHALGMGPHFSGFGFGPAIDGNFWNVLHTIYNNPTGTLESDIVINQINF
jgi:hypothetical protein